MIEVSRLESRKVELEMVMIDEEVAAAEETVRATVQTGVPVTEIQFPEGEPAHMIGFDRPRLASLLGLGE